MKYYIHPSATVEGGKMRCTYCHNVLPDGNLRTAFPCSVSVPQPFDSEVEVDVWNCETRVVFKGDFIDVETLPHPQANKLTRLAEQSVYDAGYGINTSGIYPPSHELCDYVSWLVAKGFIKS